jgi:tight adherence protein B
MGSELLWIGLWAFAGVVLASLAIGSAVRSAAARWRSRFGADLAYGLRQAFVYVDVGRLFRLNLGLLAIAGVSALVLTGTWIAVLGALVAAGMVPTLALAVLRRRRSRRLAHQWPDAVLLIAGGLRAGSSLGQALAQAARELPAPAGSELELLVREQRLGASLEAALASLERRIPLEAVTLTAAAMRIASETGGNLAETLERLAETLRRKAAVEGRIDALTAQGRLQGWVMAALPLGVGAALFVIEPESMRPLLSTGPGLAVCAVIVALELLGFHAIRRIVAIDV